MCFYVNIVKIKFSMSSDDHCMKLNIIYALAFAEDENINILLSNKCVRSVTK